MLISFWAINLAGAISPLNGPGSQIQDPSEKKIFEKTFKEKLTFGARPWIPDPGSVRKNNFSKGFLKKKLTLGARPWIPDPGSVRKINFSKGFLKKCNFASKDGQLK